MAEITFFDLLGIDPSDPAPVDLALPSWPSRILSRTPGYNVNGEEDAPSLIQFLQNRVSFSNVRPGVDGAAPGGAQITFAADVQVFASAVELQQNTFYFADLPDIGITLFSTAPQAPARFFFSRNPAGWDLIVESLPVVISLKAGIVEPLDPSIPIEGSAENYVPSDVDSLFTVLQRSPERSQLYTNVRIQIKSTGEVILEPNVPLNLGRCRFLGLPAKAVYDILLIPSPNLRELYEWARNDFRPFADPDAKPPRGAIGFRSIEFDYAQKPFTDWKAQLEGGNVNTQNIDLVCEDVVLPIPPPGFPLPPIATHGTFGIRRRFAETMETPPTVAPDAVSDTGVALVPTTYSLEAAPIVYRLHKFNNASLEINRLLFQTGEPPVLLLDAKLLWGQDTGEPRGITIGFADHWTPQAGYQFPADTKLFTIVGTTINLQELQLGVGIERLAQGTPFSQSFQVLADLELKSDPAGEKRFRLQSMTSQPLDTVLRDVGYSFGHFAMEGLSSTQGVQLIFGKTGRFRIIILEMGFAEEPTGTHYFSFSGGMARGLGGGDNVPPAGPPPFSAMDADAEDPAAPSQSGFGIDFRRLRFKVQKDESAPFLKVDGISLYIQTKLLQIQGSGYKTESEANGWKISEWGFSVQVKIDFEPKFLIAAQIVKGEMELVADPSVAFDYSLVAVTVGQVPLGALSIYGVRVLAADNMTPNTPVSAADGQGMTLYRWYKDAVSALDFPHDRTLSDWKPRPNAFSAGSGFDVAFHGCGGLMRVGLFWFTSQTDVQNSFLLVGECFLLRNPRPIAFVAGEWDTTTRKWGFLAGIDLKLTDFIGADVTPPDFLQILPALSGTLYFGNQPCTFEIGQLADPRTWLGVRVKFDKFGFKFDGFAGVCVQIVDGGPKGIGILGSITAGRPSAIGPFTLFGTIGLFAGHWKSGSDAMSVELWIQVGFKIRLLGLFDFGADVIARVNGLGPRPFFWSYSLTIRVDTPWWMPDVSFTFDGTWQAPLPFGLLLIRRLLALVQAIHEQNDLILLVPALSDGVSDSKHLYSFDGFFNVTGQPLEDPLNRSDIPIVPTDATIAIGFTNPVSNDMGVAPDTSSALGDAGVQTVQDLTVRYGLKSIAVQRMPRFAPPGVANTWTDLVAAVDTTLDLSGPSAGSETAHFVPALTFRWDADTRADGVVSPTRLLLNSSTPYTFAAASAINDEEAARNDPDFPCCKPGEARKLYPRPRILSFENATRGTRLPARQRFSRQGAWWQWDVLPQPVATIGTGAATSGKTVAMLRPAGSTVIGSVDFADSALKASCSIGWNWTGAGAAFVWLEGYSGLKLVTQEQATLRSSGSAVLNVVTTPAAPMTRAVLRLEALAAVVAGALIEVSEASYITVAEMARYHGRKARCESRNGAGGTGPGGKIAFLPNHIYQVTVTSEVEVSHKTQGSRSKTTSEVLYFRTKGLPGLNAAKKTGDELEPHIESLYPPAMAALLYREEPVVLAFGEGMSSLLLPDPVSTTPEKSQVMQLALNIDRVGSMDGMARLTVPSGDWMDAQITAMKPMPLSAGNRAKLKVRRAASFNPMLSRFGAINTAVSECGTVDPLHASQVLLHDPIGANGADATWEPETTFRATVRQQDGPFVYRNGFTAPDLAAFVWQSDAGSAAAWSITGSALVAPAASTGRRYASLGELTWNHLHMRCRFDPKGASAGIAVGVRPDDSTLQAILATIEPDGAGRSLFLRARSSTGEIELAHAAIPGDGPATLEVDAFDDVVRLRAGEITVEGPRGAIRDGRVALVANGPAEFVELQVDGLDMYCFDFRTSRYKSFQEHIDSYDGKLGVIAAGSPGLAALFAADSTAAGEVMLSSADPQARQSLFASWISKLGIALRQRPSRVSISRLTDLTGTFALLLESPEPLSFSRELKASLTQPVSYSAPPVAGTEPKLNAALPHLHFEKKVVTIPIAFAVFASGDRIVKVEQALAGTRFMIFEAPHKGPLNLPSSGKFLDGKLLESVSPKPGVRPELDPLRAFRGGAIALLRANGSLGAVLQPQQVNEEPVKLRVLSNGSETAALLMAVNGEGSLAVLRGGSHKLTLAMDRKRWRGTETAEMEARYQQARVLILQW